MSYIIVTNKISPNYPFDPEIDQDLQVAVYNEKNRVSKYFKSEALAQKSKEAMTLKLFKAWQKSLRRVERVKELCRMDVLLDNPLAEVTAAKVQAMDWEQKFLASKNLTVERISNDSVFKARMQSYRDFKHSKWLKHIEKVYFHLLQKDPHSLHGMTMARFIQLHKNRPEQYD